MIKEFENVTNTDGCIKRHSLGSYPTRHVIWKFIFPFPTESVLAGDTKNG